MLGYPVSLQANRMAPLSTILASAVFDLDTTIGTSYTSGQTWSNIVPAPADGSAQTAYDFYRGAGSGSAGDDPTFNGTANTPGAYWSFDGGDFFTLKSGSNTTFINGMHKTTGGSDWWVTCALYFPAKGATDSCLFSTRTTQAGCLIRSITSANNPYLQCLQAATAATATADSAGEAIYTTYATSVVVVITYSHSTNTIGWLINNRTLTTETFNFTTTTSNAQNPMNIGAANAGTAQFLINGTNMYHFSMGNEFLTSVKAQAITSQLRYRHQRAYGL